MLIPGPMDHYTTVPQYCCSRDHYDHIATRSTNVPLHCYSKHRSTVPLLLPAQLYHYTAAPRTTVQLLHCCSQDHYHYTATPSTDMPLLCCSQHCCTVTLLCQHCCTITLLVPALRYCYTAALRTTIHALLLPGPMHNFTAAPLHFCYQHCSHHYTTVPLHCCTTTLLLQALLYNYTAALSTAIPLHHCIQHCNHHYTAAPLHCCYTTLLLLALLYHYTSAPRTTVPLHCCS